jgi:asparagine synthase (glutamine-hydrolysing)
MCGICGIFQLGGSFRPVVPQPVLDRMTDAMTHRGPNERGTYSRPGVAMGVRRLSIVDVADGHQPVSNEEGTVWAAQNGEIYNHLRIRSELRSSGHALATRCDTEVIPHLYEQDGLDFPRRLRGIFALAVWDEWHRRGVLARDQMGVKPLYYAVVDDLVIFASELKSLLASELIAGELDYEAIESYLTLGYVPAPRTLLAGVNKLQPGHRLIVEDADYRVEPYWRYPELAVRGTPANESALAEALRQELDEAVRLQLMSDVPLGLMLSGGLDSSIVLALMARHTTEPVKTFSVGFSEGTNELDDARSVARHFGTEHHELELLPSDAVDLDDLVWALDEPLADISTLGFYALSQLAARDVTVALSGQGADELLAGYRKHQAASVLASWQRLPAYVRRIPEGIASRSRGSLRRAGAAAAAEDAASRLLAMSGLLVDGTVHRMFHGPLADATGISPHEVIAERLGSYAAGPLESTLYLDAQLALPDLMLHYFDRASMAHSLEVRVPFLDHHVVELCAQIPPELKVRGRTRKYLLRRVAAPLVPPHVLRKRKVGFFHSAAGTWFRNQADTSIAEYLLSEDPAFGHFLDAHKVRTLVADHRRTGVHSRLLLAILMLEVWLRHFLPRALPRPSQYAATIPA